MEQAVGRLLIIGGILLVAMGAAFLLADKIPFIGKLPGDIRIERENFRFYFPLGTSLVLSILLTAIFWIISIIGKK